MNGNKILLLILFLNLFTNIVKSQSRYEISTGVTLNSASSRSLRSMIPDFKSIPRPGFTIGVSKNIIFNEKHHYQLGLSYINKRSLSETSSLSNSVLVSSNYIDIPFCRVSTVNKVHFEYGLYTALLLWRNYIEDDIANKAENAMKYDIGLRGGIGYAFDNFTVKTIFAFGLMGQSENSGALYSANRTVSLLLCVPLGEK